MIVGGITETQNNMNNSIGKNIFSYIVPANKETYKSYDIPFKKSKVILLLCHISLPTHRLLRETFSTQSSQSGA